jgi:general stress protein 26
VAFLIPTAGEWCSISGEASVVTDRDQVAEYYKPSLRNWFGDLNDGVHDGSAKDPRIGLLRVKTTRASYAIVEEGHLGMDTETYKHEGTGKMPRINRQGTITREEFDERKSAWSLLR